MRARYPAAEPYAADSVSEERKRIVARIIRATAWQRLRGGGALYRIPVFHPRVGRRDGFRILHVSDLHLRGKGGRKLAAAEKLLQGERLDIVLITGDIVDSNEIHLSTQERAFLRGLTANHGKYFVLGNHDRYGRRLPALLRTLRELGFRDLTNSSLSITHGGRISVVGLDEPEYGKVDAAAAFRGVQKEDFVIVATHNLDALTAETPSDIDLVLWGHLHAGEFSLGGYDGVAWLERRGLFRNLNHHRGVREQWRFLTERTLSYANPGFHSRIRQAYHLPRLNTHREGIAILTLRRPPKNL
jgi:predicted MPP superfamily phosphohydrolase